MKMQHQATSHFVNVELPDLEAVRLHYLSYGNPNNPPVFCVHGLSCNAYDFDYLARRLAEDFYVIAVDIVGRGLSSHWQNKSAYNNENSLALCLKLLQHLNIQQPVHWVGASMGGIVGMMACFLHPHLIRSLMLNDIGAVLASEGLTEIISYLSDKLPIGDNQRFEAAYRAQNEANFGIYDDAHFQHFFNSRIYVDDDGIMRLRGDYAVVRPLRELIEANGPQDISLEALWDMVKVPTLIFRGEKSLLLRQGDAEKMAKRTDILVDLQVIKNCGHMPNLMEEEQVAYVHNFLLRCGC
jgi:pimeloyl-ACP methyl ester carboxylesterase